MTKSKKEGSRKGGRKGEAVKCPHLHFKEDVIDRNVISRQQYLDLLCTPKGYRWQVGDGEPKPFEEVMARGPRKIVCSGRRLRKPERTYVHNFLAEVWALLTPEMVDRLKGMLMNEFGMTPEKAIQFLNDQEKKSGRTQEEEKMMFKMCQSKESVPMRNYFRKEFSNMMSTQIEDQVTEFLCTPRSRSQKQLRNRIHEMISDLLQEKFSVNRPDSILHTTLALIEDSVAQWLVNAVEEADAVLVEKKKDELR